MRQRKTIQLLGVVAAILLISVGYASIQNLNLTVTGNVTASPDQGNFKVAFTGKPTFTKTGNGSATLSITGDLSATMDVSGLTTVGDTLTATFKIANTSTDITAYLANTVTNTNKEYFQVTSSLSGTELAPQTGTTELRVTVKLIKTPVSGDQKDTLKVQVTASPTPISGEEPAVISFTVDGTQYTVANGTTWGDWAEDNSDWMVTENHGVIVNKEDGPNYNGEYTAALADENSNFVYSSDAIENGAYTRYSVNWGIS